MSKCSEINITTENVKSSISVVALKSSIVVCTVKGQDAPTAGIGSMIIESTFIIG